jgi:ParB family transcriptional regulator, chromosome partitioning protein
MSLVEVKLSQLRLSPLNVRKVKPSAIDSLAADIAAHGLLQNLLVYEEDGKMHVFAGGRRYRALKQLEKARTIKPHHPVMVDIRSKAEAIELSLAEDSAREAMHPADAINAYGVLNGQGQSGEDIAARFGVSVSYVRKILKLAGLHEDLRKALAQDRLGMEAAQALTLTDDQARQLEAYRAAGNNAYGIRRFLTDEKIATTNGLFVFIGAYAYAAAGGTITADLFAQNGEGYADNPELVVQLAQAKLEEAEQQYRALGWQDVRVSLQRPDNYYSAIALFPDTTREANAEEQAQLDSINEAIAARLEQIDADDEWSDESIRTLRKQAQAIEAGLRQHSAEQMAAGAMLLFVGHEGILEARPIRVKQLRSNADTANAIKPDYSAAMVESLSRIKTQAVREAVAANPDLALDILIESMAAQLVHDEPIYLSPLTIRCDAVNASVPDELMTMSNIASIDDGVEEILSALPVDNRLAAISAMDSATKQRLLAFLVAKQLNGITAGGPPDQRQRSFAAISEASGVDMVSKWEAPVAFFDRLKKPIILKIIAQECGQDAADNLAKLKKHDLAAVAAERMAGRGWLPAPLAMTSLDSDQTLTHGDDHDAARSDPNGCIEAEAA